MKINKDSLVYVIIFIVITQIILSLFIFFQLRLLNKRIFHTNKLVLERLLDTGNEELNATIDSFDIVVGSDSAQITLFMFTNYTCSVCNDFFAETYPRIESEFIKTGKLKLVIKLITHSGPEGSEYKSKLAICASKQGKFFDLHNRFIETERNDSILTTQVLIEKLGIDIPTFNDCMADIELDKYLARNKRFFKSQHIRGTPAFILNNNLIIGNRSYEDLKNLFNHSINNL